MHCAYFFNQDYATISVDNNFNVTDPLFSIVATINANNFNVTNRYLYWTLRDNATINANNLTISLQILLPILVALTYGDNATYQCRYTSMFSVSRKILITPIII